jgi:hypothetical protein
MACGVNPTARKAVPGLQGSLHKRASEELARWRKTLTRKERDKLYGDPLSKWAREGGSIIFVPRRKWRRKKTGGQAIA